MHIQKIHFYFIILLFTKRHNEELNDLYASPKIVRAKKMENEIGGECSTYGGGGGVYRVLVRKPEGKRPMGDPDVDGRIILRWIFRNWDVGVWTGSSWLRIGTSGGLL